MAVSVFVPHLYGKVREPLDDCVIPPLEREYSVDELLQLVTEARETAHGDSENLSALARVGQVLLAYLEIATFFGSDEGVKGSNRKVMVDRGRELQEIGRDMQRLLARKIAAKTGKTIRELTTKGDFLAISLQERMALCKEHLPDLAIFLLFAFFLELRGIGYEGEGKNTLFGGLDALIRLDVPGRFEKLAHYLVKLDPTSFGEKNIVLAHSFKVQSLIAFGRYYHRLPWPLTDNTKSIQYLEESIRESLTNPGHLRRAVDPIVARLFLVDTLIASKSRDTAKIKRLLTEAETLIREWLNPFELFYRPLFDKMLKAFRQKYKS